MVVGVKAGDRFVDLSGLVLIVVNKLQARQTLGYWVQGQDSEWVRQVVSGQYWGINFGWPIEPHTCFPNNDYLSLCRESELDEHENEFGPVIP